VVARGPAGAPRGGEVVAQGPPERVARTEGSYTGQFLAEALGVEPPRPRRPRRSRAAVRA
jgi:excinuclease ABC subunit A